MAKLSEEIKDISLESLKYNRRLWERFRVLQIPGLDKTSTVPTDLGDIREVCCQFLMAFDKFFSTEAEKDRTVILELLESIRNDLFIHLKYHLKELEHPLNKLIKELEKEIASGAKKRLKVK